MFDTEDDSTILSGYASSRELTGDSEILSSVDQQVMSGELDNSDPPESSEVASVDALFVTREGSYGGEHTTQGF